ncbi:MAG: Nodulation efficiency, NfeD [Microgenomates group bacterium GW2011_GWF2_45_18]|nr:MAG: Nodulation efficiency, NfeD [Microgenomates group bacterium GW2011_GWF1_44_10]KKU01954.1 MAG: Nodulation efficiency, NfeD [Microgenomates group bacterium GW2011_GWF2_45_18]OGJ41033.1 MAG: hypothetical protein A2378_03970 [Candidatus Pacebacteria bacterium RIFOXYB1_FULL_44_10]HAU99062.1 hypothetical protein [Candidatus Paceibacterota bacterium]HAX01223.1 hypothetical protein [Candidatus Paceibacterota bacterium]
MNLPNIFIAIGILCVLVELGLGAVTGFDLLLLGFSFLLSGAVGATFSSWQVSVVAICIIAPLMIVIGRTYTKKFMQITTKKTNIDSLVEDEGIVVKEIQPNQAGRVRVGTEIWRATADEALAENERIRVRSISGITVHVEKINLKGE